MTSVIEIKANILVVRVDVLVRVGLVSKKIALLNCLWKTYMVRG